MEKINTITLDGVTYNVADFSQSVQQAITIYNSFTADLNKVQLEVVKHQAAIQNIGTQIAEAIKKELLVKQAAQAAEDTVED